MIQSIVLLTIVILISIFLKKFFINSKFIKDLYRYAIIFIVLLIVTSIVIYPSQSVEAAYNGLVVWTTLVIPALLPFFIGSELLINLGVVKFLGILLEPIMRPLFNVPGEGSFAFAMSITSGYPVGAKIVSKLRTDKILTKVEAQRLISFCSTSGPLFMIGSVAVGMFKSSKIGILIAISHYIGAIVVGVIFSFYKKSSYSCNPSTEKESLLKKAFTELSNNSLYTPLGINLGNAVKNSLNTILMVGGFIILFAVVIRVLELLKIVDLFTSILVALLLPFKISPSIIRALFTGIFEITIGAKMVVDSTGIDWITKIAITSFLIGWSGFSIHAQVLSIIGTTDIQGSLYIFAKTLHGTISFLVAYIISSVFGDFFVLSSTVFNSYQEMNIYKKFLFNCQLSIELFIAVLISLLIISLLISFFIKIKTIFNKKWMK